MAATLLVAIKSYYTQERIVRAIDPPLIADDFAVGYYTQFGGTLVALYRYAGELFVLVEQASYLVDQAATCRHSRLGDQCRIDFRCRSGALRLSYSESREPVSTQFYSEDDEDADFGLWLANIINSHERRQILRNVWRVQDFRPAGQPETNVES